MEAAGFLTIQSMSESKRKKSAERIIKNPQIYKVCEGCDSILSKNNSGGVPVSVCPNCHGYRFDEDPDRVVSQAKENMERGQRSVTPEDLG